MAFASLSLLINRIGTAVGLHGSVGHRKNRLSTPGGWVKTGNFFLLATMTNYDVCQLSTQTNISIEENAYDD